MQKFTLVLILSIVLVLGMAFTIQAEEDWEKDLKNVRFSQSEENGVEHSNPLGLLKHPGDNDFDLFWDNFMSGDTIADDVGAVFYTDPANDLDGDGFAEILCSDDDGWTYVFENTGDNTFNLVWSFQETSTTGHSYSSITITDMDGDGLQEIASGFYNSGDVHFYEWDGVVGSDTYTEVATLSFSQGAVRKLVVDNMDADANQELVVCANDTMYIYEADAGFVFNQEFKAWGIGSFSIMSVTTADLNNNGSKEAILGHWNNTSIYIYENTAEDTYANVLPDTVEFQLDPVEDGVTRQFSLTDTDADGFPELYSGDSNGKLIVFEMQSSTWDTAATNMRRVTLLDYQIITGTEHDINSIDVGDGDEDGLLDIYVATDDNHVWDWEFAGGDFFDPLNYTSFDLGELNGANAEAIRYAGDTDGDGEKEIIVGYEGTNLFPLFYFLEHHVIPAVPALSFTRNDIFFDHVWNLAELDTEIVAFDNIGTVDMVVDSIVSSDASFTSYLANTTVIALGSEDLEIYFTALDQTIHSGVYYVIYSNSTTSPDTLNVYGDSRARPLLYMNEFQPKGTEWVEIYNMDTNPIDLTDIGITTGRNTFTPAAQFGMPVMSEIEYFQLDADWGPITSIAAGALVTSYSTSLSLNNSQDWIYLIFKDSTVIEGLGYGAVGAVPVIYVFGGDSITAGSCARVAYAGNNATDWTGDFDATPGLPNDAPAPNLGGSLIINEVDYDENFDGMYEYIEFYNPTGSDITMNGWRFTDGDDVHVINGITVPSMGVAVWDDSTNLSISSGDVASLYDDTGVRVDQMGFFENNPQPTEAIGTIQRIPDGAGPNDGYDFWSSDGGVTLFDNAPTLGTLNIMTYVIFTAQVGGDASYRSFWMNGSWDSTGMYDPNWSGPMVELTDSGVWPDTSAADNIFTGVVQLLAGTTYDWWVGSEDNTSSWLENGAQITPDSVGFIYSQTCVVDPGDAGFNQWTIGVAGDSINGWVNSDDNLTRNGWDWSGNFALSAGPMEFKFVVMHSWEASYGDGGIGGSFPNYQYTVPNAGEYTITFNDSSDTYTIVEYIPDPSILFEDDFEAYTAGVQLTVQNSVDWTPWSGTPGVNDPYVSTAYANSGVNSINVITDDDVVKAMPNYTTGAYKMSFDMYVPTGTVAYFNTLQEFDPTPAWGMQVYFRLGGVGEMDADGALSAAFTYTYDTWLHNEVIVNLEKDTAEYYIDGIRIHGWRWSAGTFGTSNLNQLGGNNFYGGGPVGTFDFYVDDYELKEISPAIFADNFDSYTAGTQLVVQDSINWRTWSSGGAGGSEDPFVTNAYANSQGNSVVIIPGNDLIKLLGSQTSGVYSTSWNMYIPDGKAGYFNTLAGFDPNPNSWALDVEFTVGGGANLFDITGGPIAFSYAYDTWQHVELVVDLDQDIAEFYFDGTLIHQWQWTDGGANPLRLDATDFYGRTADDEMYIDDFVFDTADPIVVGIDDRKDALPITFDLKQNYPNPFNPTTTIKFQLPKKADVKIVIYNMLGQVVRTIIDKSVDAGYQEVVWDGLNESGSRVATGVYIYRMQADKFVKAHKMIMMK